MKILSRCRREHWLLQILLMESAWRHRMLVIDKLTGMNKKGLRLGVITADSDFEEEVGFKADKRRKLYNGMIPCQLYQYFRTSARERLESEVRS